MIEYQYRDYVYKFYVKLKDSINGSIKYHYYSNIDSVIYTVKYKNFNFDYALKLNNNLVSVDEQYEYFKKCYEQSILNAFFKTERKKIYDSYGGQSNGMPFQN